MLRKKMWFAMLFLAVFMPSTLLAQKMIHGKWWHDKTIIQELQLTDSERKALEEHYVDSRRRMIDMKSEIERQRFELELLLYAEDTDEQRIMERYESLEKARATLSRARFQMLMDMRQTLGAGRLQQLKLIYRDRDGGNRKRFSKDRSDRDRD